MRTYLLLLFLLFGFSQSVFGQEEPVLDQQETKQITCPPLGDPPLSTTSAPFRCNNQSLYRCQNNACGKDGGGIEQTVAYFKCVTTTFYVEAKDENECPVWKAQESTSQSAGPFYDKVKGFSAAGKYQICPPSGNAWSGTPPSYECAGSCYPAPDITPLNDKTLSPKNVFDSTNRPKLPIHFDWKDNVETEVGKPPSSCTVSSYEYAVGPVSGTTQPPERDTIVSKDACSLVSDANYTFQVKACGGQNQSCGEEGELLFTTSDAPQLLSPYDEDWQEPQAPEVAQPPVQVKWCPNEEAQSYLLRVQIKDGKDAKCHPWYGGSPPDCNPKILTKITRPPPFPSEEKLLPEFNDLEGFFSKDTFYIWEVASCIFSSGTNCTNFSQAWNVKTSSSFQVEPVTAAYPPDDPQGKEQVGLPLVLRWPSAQGIFLYEYEIKKRDTGQVVVSETTVFTQSRAIPYPQLLLDTFYTWRVRGCPKTSPKECQGKWESWSDELTFKTTGAPPQGLAERDKDEKEEVLIPAVLTWATVPGAASYRYEVSQAGAIVDADIVSESSNEVSVDYPKLRMNTDYSWRVKTCADKEGNICGAWSSAKQFHTFTLKNPVNPTPPDTGELWTYQNVLSWGPSLGAKAYSYKVVYGSMGNPPPDEKSLSCTGLVGKEITPKDSVSDSSLIRPKLQCLGNYVWQAVSCLDEKCNEKSPAPVSSWTFTYVQPAPPSLPGLIPCGRFSDHPDTPFNERESCEPKHIFLLVRNLIDFALWKLSLILIVVMTVFTGFVMFTAFGGPDVLKKIRGIWKGVGIGVLVLLLSWTLLNLVLGILGFNVDVFGRWYKLPI